MKKEIEAEVRAMLDEGKSHQEVFDELKIKYAKHGKLLTEILCKLPIPARRKQYYAVWMVLLVILGLLAALRGLGCLLAPTGFERVVNGFFTVVLIYIITSVARYEKYTFQFIGALGVLNIYWIIKSGRLAAGGAIAIEGFITLGLVGLMCAAGYWIYYKNFVKHKVEKVWIPYVNSSPKLEIKATFTER